MTAVQTAPDAGRIKALAWVETKRYARHPVFLVGVVLSMIILVASLNHTTEDFYSPPVNTAFFLGVFGMIVGFRLTRSLERSAEALDSSPMAMQERVGALQIASLVPGLIGLASGLAILLVSDVKGDWVYGTWAGHERVAIVLGQTAIAALGGPLLGIAAARWLRFPGAIVVPVVVVVTWVIVGNGWTANNQDSTGWLMARLFSPFAFFTTLDTDGEHRVESWLGQPWLYLAWLVLLCVATGLVALLKDAEGETRSTLRRALVVSVVLALGAYALAVTTGPDHATVHAPSGISRI